MAANQNSEAAKERKAMKAKFTSPELAVPTAQVEEIVHVLQCKFTDSVTNAKKNGTWVEITAAVNAVAVAKRKTQEVRNKWENVTSAVKTEFTDFGKEIDMFDMFKKTPSLLRSLA